MANAAKVTLSLAIPPKQTFAVRRGARFVPTGTARKPSYVSPSTYYISLNAVYGGTSIYSTYFSIANCSSVYGNYQCTTNLPYGTFTLYTNLYDQSGNMLSTNMYSNPSAVTVYPNGSPYSNYLYVQTAGVVESLQTLTPTSCFLAGHLQSIPLYMLDADGNTIVGPLANPFTPTFTAVNGAGLAALGIYAIYGGSPVSVNNVTISDTSLYSSPYFYVFGPEGAVNVAATVQNIPIYSNNATTYTPSAGYAAVGTYIAWGIQSAPLYGIYPIAIEQSINQTVTCGSLNGTSNNWTYIGSILDPSNGNPYLVVSDNNNNVDVFDAEVAADYTRAYMFFQTAANGNPGPHANMYQTLDYSPPQSFVNFFTSANVTGRINVLGSNGTTGSISLLDTSNGAESSLHGPFTSPVALNGSTRITGSSTFNALYWSVPGTPWLYGIDTSTSTAFTTIDFSSVVAASGTAPTGQVYALSPSGAAHSYSFVRGATTGGQYVVCEFDVNPANFVFGFYCHNTGSTDSNPSSMSFDPGTGNLMWATGSNSAYAFSAYTSPSNWPTVFPAGTSIYTLSHGANRILPGLESVPGVVGFYGGPQASGPCSGSGEITWIQWNGSSWVYLANMCWPNHYVTLTQS